MERRLIEEYFAMVDELFAGLRAENLALAVETASVPELIRGYGHVKTRSFAEVESEKAGLLECWRAGGGGDAVRFVHIISFRAASESTT